MSRSNRSGIAGGPLIARLLVAGGKVPVGTMKDALDAWDRSNLSLEEVLVREHGVAGSAIAAAYARHLGLPLAQLQDWSLEDATRCAGLLPESFLRENRVLPLKDDQGLLNVALVDPSDLGLRDEVQLRAGRLVSWWVMDLDELQQALDAVYGTSGCAVRPDQDGRREAAASDRPVERQHSPRLMAEPATSEEGPRLVCLARQILGSESTRAGEQARKKASARFDDGPRLVPFSRCS